MKKKPTLLIVDKDVYYGGIFANRFKTAGWNVFVDDTLAGAKKRIGRKVPDIVMVDLEPVDEALLFLRELRQNPKTAHVLQIALTQLGDRALMQEAEEAGVDSYILKGHFVPSEAVKKVKKLLDEKSV